MEEMSFDFAKWQDVGRQALKNLEDRKVIVETELNAINESIVGLKRTLGSVDSEKKRVRIRPVLKDILVTGHLKASTKEIFKQVRGVIPSVTEASVVASLKHWAREDDGVFSENGNFWYTESK